MSWRSAGEIFTDYITLKAREAPKLVGQLAEEILSGFRATRALHSREAKEKLVIEALKNIGIGDVNKDPMTGYIWLRLRQEMPNLPKDVSEEYVVNMLSADPGLTSVLAKQQRKLLERGMVGGAGLAAGAVPAYAYTRWGGDNDK